MTMGRFDVMLLVHHEIISDESQSKNFENAFVVCYVILPNQNNCHRHAGELHNALNFVVYKGCCVRHQKVLRAAMISHRGCSVAYPRKIEEIIAIKK